MDLLIIPSQKFNQIQAIKPLTDNEKERREKKYSVIDRIKSKVERNWNKAKKLSMVLDEIIFKATDRGYSFNGRETLAKLCKCGLSTVDEALRVLKESGEVIVGYRENPNSNGYKTPVIILKNHPHFYILNELLELDKYVKQEVDQKVKNAETPCNTKDEQPKKVSTYLLPSISNTLYSDIDDKRINSALHNDDYINSIISNLRQATNDLLSERSFNTIVRKVIDLYNQGRIFNFRSYLATSLFNKGESLELRRIKDQAKRGIKQSKKQRQPQQNDTNRVSLNQVMYDYLEQ